MCLKGRRGSNVRGIRSGTTGDGVKNGVVDSATRGIKGGL